MRRIICIGNRHIAADAAGPRVHDRLRDLPLPIGVELVDGGLGGLDLLRHMDGVERVVLVDAVSGFCDRGGVVLLDPTETAAAAPPPGRFDHGAGVGYLLAALPHACERGVPEVWLVGLEAVPGTLEPDATMLDEAARLTLEAVGDTRLAGARGAP